ALFCRFHGDRGDTRMMAASDASVDKPTEEVRIVDEVTKSRRGWRGAFGSIPQFQVNQNSLDDCPVLQETDDLHRALTLWADERIRVTFSEYRGRSAVLAEKCVKIR